MLGFGYVISAVAPVALGAVRDAAGSFSAALWIMVVISASLLIIVIAARREFTLPDDLGTDAPSDGSRFAPPSREHARTRSGRHPLWIQTDRAWQPVVS